VPHPLRVAIVDDEPLAREGLRIRLAAAHDLEVVAECGDATEAVAMIGRTKPDVCFLDVQMPELDGFEATRRIRRMDAAQPWIVAVTANATDEDRAACLAAGMDDHLAKPVRPEELVSALRRAHDRGAVPADAVPAGAGARAPAAVPDPAPVVPGSPLLDPSALDRLVDLTDDRAFVLSLIGDFPGELAAMVGDIRAGTPGDLDLVRRQAHSLKSSAAQLGAQALAEHAALVETAARDGSVAEVESLLPGLDELAQRTTQALEALDGW
jgi:CheY-like chemotaxis protein